MLPLFFILENKCPYKKNDFFNQIKNNFLGVNFNAGYFLSSIKGIIHLCDYTSHKFTSRNISLFCNKIF